jgi:Fic family protein
MAHIVTLRWEGNPSGYGGRRSRASFSYEAFIPDPIAQLAVVLPGDTALAVSLAESEIRALNSGPTTGGLEAVGPLLLRTESVASSRIEGLELSQRNLARALFDPSAAKGTAKSVAGNVRAMEEAIRIGSMDQPFAVADITAIHRTLLAGTDQAEIAGNLRTVQNWVGGRLNSPIDAEYVPPPPENVPGLLEDLVAFVNREDLPAVVQAAIVHAQFETIHPFNDGNGRVGRCLIHVVLRRRGLAPTFVPPVSVVLATNANAYVRGLVAYREGEIAAWCSSFSYACRSAAEESGALAARIAGLIEEWRGRAGSPRKGSAGSKLIELLPSQPIVSVATAHASIGGSAEAVRLALNSLEERGIVRQITAGRYARAWAADELFDILNEYEHSLAAPTRTSQRPRHAPRVSKAKAGPRP